MIDIKKGRLLGVYGIVKLVTKDNISSKGITVPFILILYIMFSVPEIAHRKWDTSMLGLSHLSK